MNIGLDLAKKFEGFEGKPYKCPAGKLTIGYGTNIENGISEEEGELLLEYRHNKAKDELFKKLPWTADLDSIRQLVLIDMAYNMGVPRLKKFKKTLDFVKSGDFKSASVEMLDSRWAKQVGERAEKLSVLMGL